MTSLLDKVQSLRKKKTWVILGVSVVFFILGLPLTTNVSCCLSPQIYVMSRSVINSNMITKEMKEYFYRGLHRSHLAHMYLPQTAIQNTKENWGGVSEN